MLDIHQFRAHIEKLHEADIANKSLELKGETVEAILKQASIELQIPIKGLSYEVLSRGVSNSFLNFFLKRPWKLLVYPSPDYKPAKKKDHTVQETVIEEIQESQIVHDGDFGLRTAKDGQIYFRVSPPSGGGLSVSLDDVIKQSVTLRLQTPLDHTLLSNIITQADEQWHSVGTFYHTETADSVISVIISNDNMKAHITLTIPKTGGATWTAQEIEEYLTLQGITFGIKQEVLTNLENHPVFNTPVLIAEGQKPENGKDQHLEYLFKTEFEPPKVDSLQVVDLKENRSIVNVTTGTVIAKVIPPSEGKPGCTLKGELLPAENGKTVQLALGNNVLLSEDETSVTATIDGQVLLLNNLLSVEPLLVIDGDVKNHIDFVGTVIIHGNVEDGYNITSKADIHIDGSVGRSRLVAGGNIVILEGVNGTKTDNQEHTSEENPGFIQSGRNIWAKYIQNCHIEAGESVIVSDGILHSDIIALKKVLCKGKRAMIIGGRIRALEEINALNLGSIACTPTKLEVGQNPKLMDDVAQISSLLETKTEELIKISKNVETWMHISKSQNLTAMKQERFEEVLQTEDQLKQEVNTLTEQLTVKKAALQESSCPGKISASSRVCAGVTITIHSADYIVTSDYDRSVTFVEKDGIVCAIPYEEITDNITKKEAPKKSK